MSRPGRRLDGCHIGLPGSAAWIDEDEPLALNDEGHLR
jgi:hypothetical protein